MRLRIAFATATLGALALVTAAGCGTGGVEAALSPEASALTTLGFSTTDLTLVSGQDGSVSGPGDGDGALAPAGDPAPTGTPSADAAGSDGRHRHWARLTIRRALARNVQHGEVVVDTKKHGTVTVDVQRGTVTAISATSISVRCADGFTQTWAIGSPIHVIEHRTSVQPSQVAVGATVGVAGTRGGDTVTAKLIVIQSANGS